MRGAECSWSLNVTAAAPEAADRIKTFPSLCPSADEAQQQSKPPR